MTYDNFLESSEKILLHYTFYQLQYIFLNLQFNIIFNFFNYIILLFFNNLC